MKRLFLLVLLVIASLRIVLGQCPPNSPTGSLGFCPPAAAFPCIVRGQPFSGIIQFENWGNTQSVGPIQFTFDSIKNIPNGLTYSVFPSNSFALGETGCIQISGISNDPIGVDSLDIYITMDIQSLGSPVSGELTNIFNQFVDLGLIDTTQTILPDGFLDKYYVRIVNSGTPCPTSGLCQSEKNYASGKVFFDENGNGVEDGNDNPMSNIRIDIASGSISKFTNQQGFYSAFLDSGTFDVAVSPDSFFSVSTPSSVSYSIVFNGTQLTSANNDFGLTPNVVINDLSVSLTSGAARPGFITNHWIHYQNIGTSILDGAIAYTHSPVLSFISSSETPATQTGNTLTWNFTNLYPGQQRSIHVRLQIPANTNLLGDTLISSAGITLPNDVNFLNNKDTSQQIVTGSYDPNDKLVSPDDVKNGVHPSQPLTYTIRFQNTGTDTAFTIVVRDTLDDYLNASSFQTIAASHPYSFQLEGGKYAIWTFDNILLPDSGIDEPSSHGFVKFSINIKSNAPHQTMIENSASIYFDFNPPIHTNTVQARVDLTSGIRERELLSSSVFPNPTANAFTLILSRPIADFDVQLLDVSGRIIQTQTGFSGNKAFIDVDELENGIYFYHILRGNTSVSRGKLAVMR